jgi:hypothetical protein
MRIAPFITGLGITAVALSGCGGTTTTSEKSMEKTTVTETVSASATAPGAAPSTAASASAADLPQPPAGASPQEARTDNGVQFSRYSITGQAPQQVVDYYTGIWQGEGYTITNSGGGGGGYGQYGGSGAGATGSKSGSFVAVNAGGQTAGPTYFSVCAGADEEAVRQCCENNANNNGNDNNQNNNGN